MPLPLRIMRFASRAVLPEARALRPGSLGAAQGSLSSPPSPPSPPASVECVFRSPVSSPASLAVPPIASLGVPLVASLVVPLIALVTAKTSVAVLSVFASVTAAGSVACTRKLSPRVPESSASTLLSLAGGASASSLRFCVCACSSDLQQSRSIHSNALEIPAPGPSPIALPPFGRPLIHPICMIIISLPCPLAHLHHHTPPPATATTAP